MKINFACYQSVMFVHGGPHVAIVETKAHLERMGVEIGYFNMWDKKEKVLDCDLIQLFGANLGNYHLSRDLKKRNIKFVVMPIFYTRHSANLIRSVNAVYRVARRMVRGIWWDWQFSQDICNWAELVMPNTMAEANLIEKGLCVPKNKIHWIPNGVSEKFLSADPALFQKKYGIKDFILNVGHIGPDRKNVLSLIRALSCIDHPAVIVGQVVSSKEAELCLKEAEKNKNLILIDGIDHDSPLLASAYAACKVFALPSKFETPGIAALEAGLAGANIVITPHGGTREYFKDHAEYVNPYSIKSIQAGIEKSLNRQKTEALKKHIQEYFLWSRVAEKTLDVYRRVLGYESI
jgi:glycosyltransferase involved in cell wall biosynthesis